MAINNAIGESDFELHELFMIFVTIAKKIAKIIDKQTLYNDVLLYVDELVLVLE